MLPQNKAKSISEELKLTLEIAKWFSELALNKPQ